MGRLVTGLHYEKRNRIKWFGYIRNGTLIYRQANIADRVLRAEWAHVTPD